MKQNKNTSHSSLGFGVVLLLMSLPLLAYPYFLTCINQRAIVGVDEGMMKVIAYALPLYVVASQLLSYKIYRERKAVAWILQGLLLMVYLFCAWLVYYVDVQ